MAFDFYFTGVKLGTPISDYIIKKNGCVLLSQLNERKNVYNWIDYLRANPDCKCKLFIDSGAFSAWTKGREIDTEEYIDFINKNKDVLTICASVDNIPGDPLKSYMASSEEVEKSAQKSWENFLYMRSKMEDPDKVLYTFHYGEDFSFLRRALDYKDERGELKYIAFGGLVGKSEDVTRGFYEKIFSILKEKNKEGLKNHVFGMTQVQYLSLYPFTSADSTSWLKSANYGKIIVDNKYITISDRSELKSDHYNYQSREVKNKILSTIENHGFTLEELKEDTQKRLLFNVMVMQDWAENYQLQSKKAIRNELF